MKTRFNLDSPTNAQKDKDFEKPPTNALPHEVVESKKTSPLPVMDSATNAQKDKDFYFQPPLLLATRSDLKFRGQRSALNLVVSSAHAESERSQLGQGTYISNIRQLVFGQIQIFQFGQAT